MQYTVRPIGVVRTPFQEAKGTPIQPVMAKDSEGTVEIDPRYEAGLKDIDGFDRIYLLTYFDRAREPSLTVTPYMDDRPHGLFSTRAPSRPNPIGLSCVRLLSVDGCRLHIAEVDMLDRTPVLDIKPYSPRFDVYPAERSGWLDATPHAHRDDVTADERFEHSEGGDR
jgi:tRNA-Thr(GGU) m(6)t(6)A37 methyltransferase TsaA